MKLSKTLAGVAGLGVVAAGLISAAPASADPAPGNYQLIGIGSDTTQNVMNDLAAAINTATPGTLASWDAIGSPTSINVKPSQSGCTYTRSAAGESAEANGSGAGRSRLVEALTPGDPRFDCIQYSRSSSGRASGFTQLTWVEFASDTMTYITRSDGDVARVGLSLNDVKDVYKCLNPDIHPILPQVGSGSRAFWLGQMGISETDINNGLYNCLVPGATFNGAGYTMVGRPNVQENNGQALKTDEIMPFSVGLYNVQAAGNNTDVRGPLNVLAQIGTGSTALPVGGNTSFPVSRKLYNIIPTSKISTAPWSTVFVGPSSAICSNPAVIVNNGFNAIASCGTTS
ncbi:MAG: hypothetical protein AB7O74_02645 [Candidatus Nanopelagicales bacterium]